MRTKKGFTLLEVVIALVILSGTMITISQIWYGNQRRVRKIQDYHKIAQLMENKIAELELEWRRDSFKSIPSKLEGEFEEEQNFSWSVETQPLNMPNPQVMRGLWGQTNQISEIVARLVTQFLSSQVLEVKLSIHYKKGLLKKDYSLTSYIVNGRNMQELKSFIPSGL